MGAKRFRVDRAPLREKGPEAALIAVLPCATERSDGVRLASGLRPISSASTADGADLSSAAGNAEEQLRPSITARGFPKRAGNSLKRVGRAGVNGNRIRPSGGTY
jgi:hypothetical protein